MDFKVKCVRYIEDNPQQFTVGNVYSVVNGVLISDRGHEYSTWSDPKCGRNRSNNFESLVEWFRGYYEFERVEERKVFTKKDLKNGDVIVRRNGNAEIAIVDQGVFVTKCGFNRIATVKDDLTDIEHQWDIVKIIRPTKDYHCQFSAAEKEWGDIVYDRERDTKHLYNGKVICIENHAANSNLYTVGKIYQFVDGKLTTDHGGQLPHFSKIYSFKDWEDYSNSKFLEVKE